MIKKKDFWKICIQNGRLEVLETLYNFLTKTIVSLSAELTVVHLCEHLKGLKLNFIKYFKRQEELMYLLTNHFGTEFFKTANLSIKTKRKIDRTF